ncbi:hypothetical protein IM122_003180 [Salmonella enterica]|nr:hypothetical protein [Salmonella enterica]
MDYRGLVFPAPAGINREIGQRLDYDFSVPRASGDKPWPDKVKNLSLLCSPRQRG